MRPQEGVVSHHLIVDGCDRIDGATDAFLGTRHPHRVFVLLVAHSGHILPDFTQGAPVVLRPQELQQQIMAGLKGTFMTFIFVCLCLTVRLLRRTVLIHVFCKTDLEPLQIRQHRLRCDRLFLASVDLEALHHI